MSDQPGIPIAISRRHVIPPVLPPALPKREPASRFVIRDTAEAEVIKGKKE